MGKVWYFGAADGACDVCESASGFYSNKPSRPHLGCNCLIEEFKSDDADKCTVEYRGVLTGTFPENRASTPYRYNNCGSPSATSYVTSSTGIDDSLGSELRGVIEKELGWTPPTHVSDAEFEAPANTRGTVEVKLVAKVTNAQAEKWEVCKMGGLTTERMVDELSGSYTCIVEMEAVVDSTVCFGGG